MKDNQIRLPACVQAGRSYSPTTQEGPMDILIDDFEELIRLRLPYSTISYLALVTQYDFSTWFNSPAKFIDKWRLAMLIMKGEADNEIILNVMEGGTLYPIEEEEQEINYLDNDVESGRYEGGGYV